MPVRPVASACLLALVAGWSVSAGAQQVYRIVGPDGRVTFSDRPPADASVKATTAPVLSVGSDGNASLPFELRNAASRYPVTLYSGANCGPCATARSFLAGRGIPYSEKTVTSQEDIEALNRLSGATVLPFLTIGGQQLKGYSEAEWTQFLDAAGYPRTSQLPASYRNPQPTPLVAVQTPARPTPARPQEQQRPEPPAAVDTAPASGPTPDNPAGIRF